MHMHDSPMTHSQLLAMYKSFKCANMWHDYGTCDDAVIDLHACMHFNTAGQRNTLQHIKGSKNLKRKQKTWLQQVTIKGDLTQSW